MKYIHFILILISVLCLSACSSVYKKHYDKGFTFLNHAKKSENKIASKKFNSQEQSIAKLNDNIKEEKRVEQQKAEKQFQSYHKSIDRINNNAPGRLLTSINKFTLGKIEALKADTLYRKEPSKNSPMSDAVKSKAQAALILSIVSIALVWIIWILALIPAIIALAMAKKAKAMAKLNGEAMPSEADTARIIAWITIGLNILFLVILLLYIALVLLIISSGI